MSGGIMYNQTKEDLLCDLNNISEEITNRLGIPVLRDTSEWDLDDSFFVTLNDSRDKITLNLLERSKSLYPPSPETVLPKVTLVDVNEKFRQFVLSIKEPARKLTRQVRIYSRVKPNRNHVISNFRVTLPTGTKYVVNYKGKSGLTHIFSVTARVSTSDVHLLIGYDESHLFVSMLPGVVSSVPEAHDILTPEELRGRADLLRQGEFFFVPASEDDIRSIKTSTACGETYVQTTIFESDHAATCFCQGGENHYAVGAIMNERHDMLFLHSWHRVVRNCEIESENGSSWD